MTLKKIRNNLILELHIPDFNKAEKFYRILGFKKISYDKNSGGGSDLGYMVLGREDKLGKTLINFYGDKKKVSEHAQFNKFPRNTPRGYEVEITISVDKVERLWTRVKDKLKSNQISQKLEMKRWGKKDFRVIDPFGFYLRFTELVDWGI